MESLKKDFKITKKQSFKGMPRQLKDIPKVDGFMFYAVLKSGKIIPAEVEKRQDGCHYVKGHSVIDLAGWYRVADILR